ncbi:MAG: TonB-dependent siderophore receptor [Aquabacterium sp.]|uniref:TonB-dependent siderophore receptor n=1 Tax=Aquabacterium sp. TaxID=1872578 RepID=UPI00271DB094|nr:TonB-dependent siderophore receptor [Aquabacterium sp.]MDO9002947.1 TonB-dependent siderophore receptor [Aquabacterium sp.]
MHYLPRQRLLAAALGAACSASCLSLSPLAIAQPAAATERIFEMRVPAQPLASALNELSRQTGIQLLAATELTDGVKASAVQGRLTAEQALSALLAGTSLQAVRSADNSFAIRRIDKASQVNELPAVTVSAARPSETATSHINGFVAKRSATGTKTDTPLVETPQSISVVGAEEIDTIKAQSLIDALGYVAGVSRVEGSDRTTETLLIRGFEVWAENSSIYRDGLKYSVNVNNGTQEPYGFERVELLKGAASVLYGAASPGGIINTVSKRPTTSPLRELNAEVGSFNRTQVSGDFGGALDKDAEWSYRLTFLARKSDTFIDFVPDDRTYIAPALKWQPSAATSLTLLSEFQHDRTKYVPGMPPEGMVQPNPNGQVPRSRFIGEPGFDKFDNKRGSIGYLFEHAFDEQLKLRHNLRLYSQANERSFTYATMAMTPDMRSTSRGIAHVEDSSKAINTDTSLEYKWSMGSIQHTTLAGLDYSYQKHQQISSFGSAPDLDLFTPGYGSPLGALTYAGTKQLRDRKIGLYAQDQMKVNDKWVVLLGGRQDWSQNDSRQPVLPAPDWLNEDSKAFTSRAGLVYLADNGLAPFLSYSQSFEPTSGLDSVTNERLKPTKGEQYETGLRYQPKGSDFLLTAAIYQLTKSNVTVSDPTDPSGTTIRQVGQVRSRGLELEARTSIGRHTNLSAAYAYTDARTTDPLAAGPKVTRTGGVPYNQFSVWADHDLADVGLPGFKAGAGLRYVDATAVSGAPSVTVPSFALVDAMISYRTGPWRLALNATNLTDKDYVASCTFGCFYGEPRKVIGTVTYRW